MNMNLGVMKAISFITDSDSRHSGRTGDEHSLPVRPSAALRLITAFVCILLCALSRNAWFTVTILAAELLRTCLKPSESVARIVRPVIIPILFTAVFALPSVFLGNPGSFGTIVMKVAESVLVLSLMNEEVSWKETIHALESFRCPDIVISTLDGTVRFLMILGRFSDRMLEAVSLRRVGRKKWNNAGTGGILGTTFLKSQRIAERTSEAMICRGFSGDYRRSAVRRKAGNRRQKAADVLYALLIPVMAVLFIYTQSLMT